MSAAYLLYGLHVRSELSLPELLIDPEPDGAPPDIELRMRDAATVNPGPASPWTLPATEADAYHAAAPGMLPVHLGCDARGEFADVLWAPIGRIVARAGNTDGTSRITIVPAPSATEELLRLLLLGPIIGILLHLRGWLVLHASAVDVRGGAIAILGNAGRGKSTTAAALAARGHPLVADDVVGILPGVAGTPVMTVPGFPQLKLWPDAAAAVAGSADSLPRLLATAEKRAHRIPEHFAPAPLPLRAIFVLDAAPSNGAAHAAALLTAGDAFVELVRNAYGARTIGHVDAARQFEQMGRVAASVPMWRLQVRRGLDQLAALVTLIEGVAA